MPKAPVGMPLPSWLCMLPGLIYNGCPLELANILMLENVNKLVEAFFYIFSIKKPANSRLNLTSGHK